MTHDEYKKIQVKGSSAFEIGLIRSDNPYYQSNLMPYQTGDSLEEWRVRCDAWISGFTIAKDVIKRKIPDA